ncbi:MAG: O-antigen ligase family protein [Defluviitaleaceae bacterium]|nr:O-antigen ligase family protein [Defluviitaleaceae bacterium]
MLTFYLNIYRNSIIGSALTWLTAFIMRLWHGSLFRRLFFGDWNIGFERTIEFKYLAKLADGSAILGFVNRAENRLYDLFCPLYEGSFFLRLAGGFFGVKDIRDYRGILLVLLTVICIPILPTMVTLALCCLSVGLFACRFLLGRTAFKFGTADFFIALLAVVIFISILISYIPSVSARMGLVYILFILFYFVVRNLVDTRAKLFAVVSGILVSGFVVSFLGILQEHIGLNFVMTEAWIDTDMFGEATTRVYSTLANPNMLAAYLIFVMLLAFAGLYYFENYFYKFVSLGIFATAALCMIYTHSRGAWLGLILAFGLYALFKDRRLIWLGVLALPFLPFFVPETIWERLLSVGNLEDTSTTYRLYIWLASLSMIQDFWPIGIGPGTRVFVFIYQKYAFSTIYAPHSHNLFLQLLIDYGISGLLLFSAAIFMFYRAYLSNLKHTKESFLTAAGAAICAGMGGYLLQGMTDHVWYNYRLVAFFWVMIAIAVALGQVMKGDNNNVEKV